jgi:hypothetical protein
MKSEIQTTNSKIFCTCMKLLNNTLENFMHIMKTLHITATEYLRLAEAWYHNLLSSSNLVFQKTMMKIWYGTLFYSAAAFHYTNITGVTPMEKPTNLPSTTELSLPSQYPTFPSCHLAILFTQCILLDYIVV